LAIELTAKAKAALEKHNVTNQIILSIQGIPTIYGAIEVGEDIRVGDDELRVGDFIIGGSREILNSRPWISLDKTSNSISAQMRQEEGGSTSISKFNISLVDIGNFVSNEFAPGNFVEDILGAEADVFLSFEGLSFPEDATKVFNGIIDNVSFTGTTVEISVAHPEKLKKQELFLPHETQLSAALGLGLVPIYVDSITGGEILSDGVIVSEYLLIDDELIEVSYSSDTPSPNYVSYTRGALGTTEATHDIEADVTKIFRIQGNPIDLALQLMLSDTAGTLIFEGLSVNKIVDSKVYFNSPDLVEDYGLVVGDKITTYGNAPGNFLSSDAITEIGKENGISYIKTAIVLLDEYTTTITADAASKYNVLGLGCGMKPRNVDIAQHEAIKALSGFSFPDMDFLLDEEVNAKDFISKELYYPVGMYSLNRKAKASVGLTLPPIALQETKVLSFDTITNSTSLVITRSTNQNFYNTVHYKYAYSLLDEKFLRGRITIDETSNNRIKVGTNQLLIETRGFTGTAQVSTFLDAQAARFLDRYALAAESIQVEVAYAYGFSIELGDRVQIDGADLGIFFYNQGTRAGQPKIFEVMGKNLNVKSGKIMLTCLDTVFGLDGRFVTVAPGSIVGAGASLTKIPLVRSQGVADGVSESFKFTDFIGDDILVHNQDWTAQEIGTLEGIGEDRLTVSGLTIIPTEGSVVEAPEYDSASKNYKVLHGFLSPSVLITSVVSDTIFDVADSSILFEGASVRVNNADFSTDSSSKVDSIAGNTITLTKALNFTPIIGDSINKIGFVSDKGNAYLYI
jgi:hypothetical protein